MGPRKRTGSVAVWLCAMYAAATSAWYVVWRAGFAERSADKGNPSGRPARKAAVTRRPTPSAQWTSLPLTPDASPSARCTPE